MRPVAARSTTAAAGSGPPASSGLLLFVVDVVDAVAVVMIHAEGTLSPKIVSILPGTGRGLKSDGRPLALAAFVAMTLGSQAGKWVTKKQVH